MHLARYFAGDALGDLRDGVRTTQKLELRVAEHVDEAGRYYLVMGVDHSCCSESGDGRPDVGDAITADCDCAAIPRIARAVDDPGVRDEDVVALRIRRARE